MTLHFIDKLPVLGYCEVDDHVLAFAWQWQTPRLRVTFAGEEPHLIGQVTHLDCLPRLVAAPDNLAWLAQDDPTRTRTILDHAINLWCTKERLFHTCNG